MVKTRRHVDGVTVDCNAETYTEMQTDYSDFEMSRNYLPEHVNATVFQVPPLSQAGNPSTPTRIHGTSVYLVLLELLLVRSDKGNNKITEFRSILQRESQNS